MSTLHNRFVSITITDNSISEQQDEEQAKEIITKKKDTNVCSICYENMEDSFTTTLKCKHTYHTDCYTTYIAYNVINKKETINCPLCRNNVLKIAGNKPEIIHIITENNDIETETDIQDDEIHNEICISGRCCVSILSKAMIGVALYFAIDALIYCSNNIC